ncbi:MAG: hypothetical protein IKG81_05625 [Bacteroidales bacterium]|nr:hypothetical protein [Bacteroidales bacterium]
MESSTTYPNNTTTKPLRNIEVHHGTPQVQTTPKERLHAVEEFIDKLEQAVLERL